MGSAIRYGGSKLSDPLLLLAAVGREEAGGKEVFFRRGMVLTQ